MDALFDFRNNHCIIFRLLETTLNSKELEEFIYEYGHIMYQIGRAETDDKIHTKDYNKLVSRKEKIVETFNDHFKSNFRLAKTLHLT